jgi:hypothetical protein
LGLFFFIAKWRIFATKKIKSLLLTNVCLGEISPKTKNQKFKNKVVFGGFQSPKGRVGESKNLQIFIFAFQCIAKNIER